MSLTTKKKTLLIVSGAFMGLIGLMCVVIAMQPADYLVSRSATMAVPAEKVFPLVNDLKAWDDWSPWSKLDPDAKSTISDPSAGQGATTTWSGNDKVGEGVMTILKSEPNTRVELEQAFVRPMEGKARFVFTLVPVAEGTQVTMAMDGTKDFMSKAVCMFMDMDTILGKDFDQSLTNIKALAENQHAGEPAVPRGE